MLKKIIITILIVIILITFYIFKDIYIPPIKENLAFNVIESESKSIITNNSLLFEFSLDTHCEINTNFIDLLLNRLINSKILWQGELICEFDNIETANITIFKYLDYNLDQKTKFNDNLRIYSPIEIHNTLGIRIVGPNKEKVVSINTNKEYENIWDGIIDTLEEI